MYISYEASDLLLILQQRKDLLQDMVGKLKTSSSGVIGPIRGLSIIQVQAKFESELKWIEEVEQFAQEALRSGSKVYVDKNEYGTLSYSLRDW